MAHDDLSTGRIAVPGGSEAVGDLAKRVLSVLNARQVIEETHPKQAVLDLLYKGIVSKGAFDPVSVFVEMRRHGVSIDAIIDHYIPLSAERIGEDWVSDDLDFAQVTIASLRLQSLLGETAFHMPVLEGPKAQLFSALVVMTEHEQHTLGGFVVSAQLRRQNVAVETVCAEKDDSILQTVSAGDYDAVLFSCSSEQALASVKDIVLRMRTSEIRIPVIALGGLIVTRTNIAASDYNVDVVSNDLSKILSHFDEKSAPRPAAKK